MRKFKSMGTFLIMKLPSYLNCAMTRVKLGDNKKRFQQDTYRPLSNCMYFSGHQMSVLLGGPQVNDFEQVSSDGHQMSLTGEQGWGVPLQ